MDGTRVRDYIDVVDLAKAQCGSIKDRLLNQKNEFEGNL
jgi:UDP-glucose 4-epimerase